MAKTSIRAFAERHRLVLSCIGVVAACATALSACNPPTEDPGLVGATIVFTAAPTEVRAGATVRFTAHLEDANHQLVDREVFLEISDEAESLVDFDSETGDLKAADQIFTEESVDVVASVNDVNVPPVTKSILLRSRVISVTLTPPLAGALVVGGATHQLTAAVAYATGSSSTPAASVSWTSSNSAVFVDQTGKLTPFAATPVGQPAQITARAEGITSAAMSVTVTGGSAGTVASILVQPTHVSLAVTQTQQYTAQAFNSSNVEITGLTLTWGGTNSAANVSPTGFVTALATGGALVTATFSGITGTAAVSVGAVGSILAPLVVITGGAAVADAVLTAFSGTTIAGTGKTNTNGRGYIPGLAPGTYVVTVGKAGFATQTFTGIVVVQNNTTSLQATITLVP